MLLVTVLVGADTVQAEFNPSESVKNLLNMPEKRIAPVINKLDDFEKNLPG